MNHNNFHRVRLAIEFNNNKQHGIQRMQFVYKIVEWNYFLSILKVFQYLMHTGKGLSNCTM